MEKAKILLAVGHIELENYLKSKLGDEYDFVGPVVHREGIVKLLTQEPVDILIVRETLEGSENILSIVYKIRSQFSKLRIIFLAGNRTPGDELLSTLVNYGVYDILYGSNISANKIVEAVYNVNSHADVAHLQPIPTLDEKRNKVLFENPIIEEDEEIENENSIEGDDTKIKTIKKQKQREKKEPVGSKFIEFAQNIKFPNIPSFQTNVKNREKGKSVGSAKNRVITFIGGKNGVGTTTLAINVAFELASKGKRVIFLEVNSQNPAVSYWYEMGYTSSGIDSVIEGLEKQNYNLIDAIIGSSYLKTVSSNLKKSYIKYPDTLDFMFFSKEYITGLKKEVNLNLTKELYMHLLYQEGYDYVIIDVAPDIKNQATLNGLLFSNIIFSVITQDVSTVGYHLFQINELEKKGLFIKNKNNYIVNRYTDANINIKEIQEWLETENVFSFANHNKELINANLKGLPACLDTESKQFKEGIVKIIKKITE